jgi:hypothetical protein
MGSCHKGSSGVKTPKEIAAILLRLKARPTKHPIFSAACKGVKSKHGENENQVPAQAELHDVP